MFYKQYVEESTTTKTTGKISESIEATDNGYEGVAGAERIVRESLEDWALIEEALTVTMLHEQKAVYEGDEAKLAELEENTAKKFLDAVINAFKKLIAKVKELFKNFRVSLDKVVMSDAKFADKYEKTIKDKDLSKLKIANCYDFNDKFISDVTKTIEDADKAVEDEKLVKELNKVLKSIEKQDNEKVIPKDVKDFIGKDTNKTLDEYRGALLKQSSVSSDKFKKIFDKAVGTDETIEFTSSNYKVNEEISILKDAKETKNQLKEIESAFIDKVDALLDEVETAKSEIENAKKDIDKDADNAKSSEKALSNVSSAIKKVTTVAKKKKTITVSFMGYVMNTMSLRRKQAKRIVATAAKYKPTEEGTTIGPDDVWAAVLN